MFNMFKTSARDEIKFSDLKKYRKYIFWRELSSGWLNLKINGKGALFRYINFAYENIERYE